MDTLCPESVSPTRKKLIIRELVQGKEAATQLKLLLQKPLAAEGSLSPEDLVSNVLRAFTESLSVLTSSSSEPCGGGVSKKLLNSGDDLRSEGSNEGRKISFSVKKGGTGCYQRRKNAQTLTIISHTTDDNHAWRKYGQKEILNSKFPRSYFRCTLKYDQGCQAIKHVQRTPENPDLYQITYLGIHTCKATPKAPHLVKDSSTWESFLMNSHSVSDVSNEQDHPIGSLSPTIEQEYHKEDTPSDVTDHNCNPSLCQILKDFEPSKPAMRPLKMASDDADTVYSCKASQSLDMDFGVDSVHFGTDHFHFDESNLL